MTRVSPVRLAWSTVPPGTARRDVAWRLLREWAPGAALSNPCPRCGGPHGPVRLDGSDLVASVTYAAGFALVGVAPGRLATALGIDAEPTTDPRRDAAGLQGTLGPGRPADVRSWTRVEAVLKADGRGLRVDPALVEIAESAAGWSARLPDRFRPFTGLDLEGPRGIVVSAAIVPTALSGEEAAAVPDRSRR